MFFGGCILLTCKSQLGGIFSCSGGLLFDIKTNVLPTDKKMVLQFFRRCEQDTDMTMQWELNIRSYIYFGLSPFPVIVTTRILTFVVGDPYKPSFATITGKGDNPTYIWQFGFVIQILISSDNACQGDLTS